MTLINELKNVNRRSIVDINFLISNFEEEYKEENFEKREELRKQFVAKFPLESIKGNGYRAICSW